ncbi:MAG: F0F1 ATP synthase subunit A [Bacteroidota bacterium]
MYKSVEMASKYYRSVFYFILWMTLSVFTGNPALYASESKTPDGEGGEKFNAGKTIIEHIIDAHEWHIAKVGETNITVPLPVILIDEGKIVCFMSGRFHHGETSYNGYKLENEGKNAGKIVKVKADGITVDEEASLPLDFSITKNVLTIFISVFLLCVIFISIARKYKKREGHAPKGLQSLVEPVILFIRDDIARPAIGEKKYEKYMPYLLTLFFFIFFTNLLGLIPFFPGGANVTGNVAVTMVLALFTFIITTISSKRDYWLHIINTPGVPFWLKIPIPLMPLVELIGVFTKPFVLMIRLFANITAGHIIILGFMCLIFIFGQISPGLGYGISIVSIIFGIFMSLIELLVAFIQAYVFTLLSAIYFGMAMAGHEESHEHGH